MSRSNSWLSSALNARRKPSVKNILLSARGDWLRVRIWMRMATHEALAELEPRKTRSRRKAGQESAPGICLRRLGKRLLIRQPWGSLEAVEEPTRG
jgi:hypothetical protein